MKQLAALFQLVVQGILRGQLLVGMRAIVLRDDRPDGFEVQIVQRIPECVEEDFDFLPVEVLSIVECAIDLGALDGIQLIIYEVVVCDATGAVKS